MTFGVYCYYDDVKHETIYVGKDSNIDRNKRHKDHHYSSNKYKQKINTVLQNDLENNNINRYTYVVLEKSDDWTNEDLNEKEKYWISLFKPKFNFTEGGDGTVGFEQTEETRKKISEARKGKYCGENHPMYGKKIPEETRKKMSEAHKGKKQTEETRKKISEARKGKYCGENNPMYGRTGENNPMYGRTGENSPHWKDYARVIKKGVKPNGKQNYALKQNGEIITTSIYKEKLEKLAEERNKKQDKQK